MITTLTTLPGTSELSPQPRDCAQAVPGKRECSQSPPPPFRGEEAPSAYSWLRDELSLLSLPTFQHQETPRGGRAFPPSERSQFPSAGTCWHPDHPPQPHWSSLALRHAWHTGSMVGKAHVEHRRAKVTSSPLTLTTPPCHLDMLGTLVQWWARLTGSTGQPWSPALLLP